MITIADIPFDRWAPGADMWISTDKRILLQLSLDEPNRPWRVAVDGRWWRSKFSTPYVAITRVKERISYNETRRHATDQNCSQNSA